MAKPAAARVTYPDDFLAPLFGETGEDGEDPIPAKDIGSIILYWTEEDWHVPTMFPNGLRGGKVKVPSEFLKIKPPKQGQTEFAFNPYVTTERMIEEHFGRGCYFVQPRSHLNKTMAGRNLELGGPKRFQGKELPDEPEVAETTNAPTDPNEPDLAEAVETLTERLEESTQETNRMFQEHLAKPVPQESATTRLKEIAEIASIFRPPAEVSLATDANSRRIDDLMREHRKDLEKRDTKIDEDRKDYRTELDGIRKKFDTETDEIRKKSNKEVEDARSDYKEELTAKQKIFDSVNGALTKRVDELDKDLRDLRKTSDDEIDKLRFENITLSNKVLAAELHRDNAQQKADAANKDADELEEQLRNNTPATAAGGSAVPSIPGVPGWVNALLPVLLPILPVVAPIIGAAMKASGAPLPPDMPPFIAEQMRAAMAQQGPPPGFQGQPGFPGFQGQGPPPGWSPQPPPGWVPVPQQPPQQQPQQGWQGPPPGWAPVAPQPMAQQGPPGWPPQQPPPGWAPPQQQPQYAPEGPPPGYPPQQPFPIVGGGPPQPPPPTQREQEAWWNQQQELIRQREAAFAQQQQQQQQPFVQQPQQPIIAVRHAQPIEDDDDSQGAPS